MSHAHTKVFWLLQELFPRSYAQTAEWLWRERTAYQDTLARCQARLDSALREDATLASLVAFCQVLRPTVHMMWTADSSTQWSLLLRGLV